MRQIYFLFLALFAANPLTAQIINFPDANLKTKLLSNSVARDENGAGMILDANGNSQIEVSEAQAVYELFLNNIFTSASVKITNLTGLSNFTNLRTLECIDNLVTSFDATALIHLQTINFQKNKLTSLLVGGLDELTYLNCVDNLLTALDVSDHTLLTKLYCSTPNNNISNLNFANCAVLKELSCHGNPIGTSLDLTPYPLLEIISVGGCGLTNISLTGLVHAKELNIGGNLIQTLNLDGLVGLESVMAPFCGLTSIEAHHLPLLNNLYLSDNPLTALNILDMPALRELNCTNGSLTQLSLPELPHVETLYLTNNQLTSLDISGLPMVSAVFCEQNQLSTLDISQNISLMSAYFEYNQLVWINAKNGKNELLAVTGNTNLSYVCADDSQIANLTTSIQNAGISNCEINSYCSFVPGGTSFTVTGTNRIDLGGNGCQISDPIYPKMKFLLSGASGNGTFVSNCTGDYTLPFLTGTHTITPAFENPGYFTVDPPSVSVTFPAQATPVNQNFCIAGSGSHPDLEIILVPLSSARPGFDAQYKILIRNKGNAVESGTVTVEFDGNVSDFMSATTAVNVQTENSLTWNFVELSLFEEREIIFTLNLNSPIETPPLSSGAFLFFYGQVTSDLADETPVDNTVTFFHTVTNSFDPNDKTCLEGIAILPEMAGQYVHYQIRFENTGTANAQNIVVKDIIDTTKFDIASLIPLDGSHDYYTRITGNKVEFIFENINLPFDDANNDGYVVFKIKTKPTLVLGNTFSNTASIYFDYNHPIVTDPAVTTIAILQTQDFEFSDYFSIYPNPADDKLNIGSKQTIAINTLSVYNTLGQLVLVVPNAQQMQSIDVSMLKTGQYFVKIDSDRGTANCKFIKK